MNFTTISASNPSSPFVTCIVLPPPPPGKFLIASNFTREIAEDSISDTSYSALSIYQSQKYLYTQLQNDTALLDTNSTYSTFYDSMSTTNVGNFVAVEDSIKSLLTTPNIMVTDSILYIAPTGDTIISDNSAGVGPRASYLAVASMGEISPPPAYTSAGGIQLSVYTCSADSVSTYSNSVSNAIAANAAITASAIYETNEQSVNDIYLKTLVSGIDTFTSGQFDTLLFIAYQCPFTGGNAVYDARALVHFAVDTLIFNDDSLCSIDSIEADKMKAPKQQQNVAAFVNLYPNPASTSITVSYSLGGGTQGTLFFYDELGQNMINVPVATSQGIFSINIATFPPGIYFYKLISGKTNIGVGKLAIIKP